MSYSADESFPPESSTMIFIPEQAVGSFKANTPKNARVMRRSVFESRAVSFPASFLKRVSVPEHRIRARLWVNFCKSVYSCHLGSFGYSQWSFWVERGQSSLNDCWQLHSGQRNRIHGADSWAQAGRAYFVLEENTFQRCST
ncbi:hypothetical protein M408DRAFT_234724 [Serendipita vermifera MAFF 305830]|uniref:Uncharacterized protein n=1 Tax=Serendipita vermifera MAFF 305830 TaxID=933852 RepID=A0A0C3AYJ6_SERVB|nr:hypothetical protein M408DRAFT_234724 [Serendipita vermifera MAFF 305830]